MSSRVEYTWAPVSHAAFYLELARIIQNIDIEISVTYMNSYHRNNCTFRAYILAYQKSDLDERPDQEHVADWHHCQIQLVDYTPFAGVVQALGLMLELVEDQNAYSASECLVVPTFFYVPCLPDCSLLC